MPGNMDQEGGRRKVMGGGRGGSGLPIVISLTDNAAIRTEFLKTMVSPGSIFSMFFN
jgi:hypothetical protein